jgi:hypothetical protein
MVKKNELFFNSDSVRAIGTSETKIVGHKCPEAPFNTDCPDTMDVKY